MLNILLATQALLLVLVVILAVLLAATIRQVGVLFERVAPLGALTLPQALRPGDEVPPIATSTLTAQAITLGGPRSEGRAQLLLFISPSCPMCKQVLGWVRSFARAEARQLDIVLVGDGSAEEHAAMAATFSLASVPLVVDGRVGMRYQVGKLPYAMLIDSAGTLRSSGLINNREHLESLVLAQESGVASLQEYLQARQKREAS